MTFSRAGFSDVTFSGADLVEDSRVMLHVTLAGVVSSGTWQVTVTSPYGLASSDAYTLVVQ